MALPTAAVLLVSHSWFINFISASRSSFSKKLNEHLELHLTSLLLKSVGCFRTETRFRDVHRLNTRDHFSTAKTDSIETAESGTFLLPKNEKFGDFLRSNGCLPEGDSPQPLTRSRCSSASMPDTDGPFLVQTLGG